MWQSHEPNCKTNSFQKIAKKSLDRRVHFFLYTCYTRQSGAYWTHGLPRPAGGQNNFCPWNQSDILDTRTAETCRWPKQLLSVESVSQSVFYFMYVHGSLNRQSCPWSRYANFDFLCGGLSNKNHVPYTSTPTRPKLQQRSVNKVHTQILTHTRARAHACTHARTHTHNQKRF